MTLLFAGFVIVAVAAVAVAAMLLVRRTAPEGSYFADGDRARMTSDLGSMNVTLHASDIRTGVEIGRAHV